MSCAICGGDTLHLHTIVGRHRRRPYDLRRCPTCEFSFVSDPDTDYENIYNGDYYNGRGADPLINYAEDLAIGKDSIKLYEARGVERWAQSIIDATGAVTSTRRKWLDFGCGTGYLVEYLSSRWDAIGYETGAGAEFARGRDVPLIASGDALHDADGTFDVISCIEVLEHVADPLSVLRTIHSLLKPGGVVLFTTGNSSPYLDHLQDWSYVAPEIHISFLSEKTSPFLLETAGFKVEHSRWGAGFSDIYRYKILRNLGRKRRSSLEKLVPWPFVASIAEARFRLARHPSGRKL